MTYMVLMRRAVTSVLALGMVLGGLSFQPPAARAAGPKPTVVHRQLVTITATIVTVDLRQRLVTLRGPAGNTVAVWVDPSVTTLSAVKPGDRVAVRYYRSLLIKARKAVPGEKLAVQGMGATLVSDERGQTPAAIAAHQVQVTARVMALDKPEGLITLKGPQGNIRTFQVNPALLTNVTVGDLIVFTYSEARAVSIVKG
jgi:hypothetical protein